MVVYQKLGVIISSLTFAVLQKLKFQIFRLFIVQERCGNHSDCMNSSLTPNVSDISLQDALTQFTFKSLLINNCISIVPCLLLAAWSDRHGRKVLLYLPFLGSFVSDIFMLVLPHVQTSTETILMTSEAIHGLFGGPTLMVLGCMCYVTDTTDHRMRTWFIGLIIGLLNVLPVTEMVLQYYMTPTNLQLELKVIVSTTVIARVVIGVIFLLYLKFCVVESVFVLGSYDGNPWLNLLTPINVTDTVNCVFKRRLDNMRFFIISLSTIFLFYCLCLHGNIVSYPNHFKNVFHWAFKDIMIFSAIFTVSQNTILWLTTLSGIKFRCLDIDLGLFGSISLATSCLALTFIKDAWIAVLGCLVGVASLLIPTAVISVLSKLIERIETGSMYAGIGCIMLLSEVVAVPSYEALDKIATQAGVPNVIFLCSLMLASFGMLFFMYLKKNISPDLLGHLNCDESLALLNRKGHIEPLFD